jgi:hypothetical protein
MARAVRFGTSLGCELLDGGDGAEFSRLCVGKGCVKLTAQAEERAWT